MIATALETLLGPLKLGGDPSRQQQMTVVGFDLAGPSPAR